MFCKHIVHVNSSSNISYHVNWKPFTSIDKFGYWLFYFPDIFDIQDCNNRAKKFRLYFCYIHFNVCFIMPLSSRKIYFYILLCHYLLLFKPIVIDVRPVLTLVLILAFILPQFSMYLWKILTRNEFKFTKTKLMFRLLGIHGYLCALLLIRYDFVLGLAIIIVSGLMFAISREVSSWKSIADNHNNVRWRKGQAKYQLLQLKKSFSLNLRNSKELVQDTNAEGAGDCVGGIAEAIVTVTAVIMCPCLACG